MGNPCAVGSNPTPSAIRIFEERHGFAGARRASGGFGGPAARPPISFIGYTLDVVVLDGEVAVPCNPQSAPAGSNSRLRASRVE